ncbi:hypothetical protein Q7P37_001755 [Cladosporium fusiforme]
MNPTHTLAKAALRSARSARTPSLLNGNVRYTILSPPKQHNQPNNPPNSSYTTCLRTPPQPRSQQPQPHRTFTSTRTLLKKGAKAAREEKRAAQPASSPNGASEDPSDFTALEADIAAAIERLKDDLSKLRAGGRFNPEVLESLRVQPDKTSAKKVKLSDVAQVVPKGRQVQVIVGEKERRNSQRSRSNSFSKENHPPLKKNPQQHQPPHLPNQTKTTNPPSSQHIKPITTAIQASTLSLTPQPDPTGTNPLLLVINIPPPTSDSRKAAVTEATRAGEKASTAIKDARGKQQKKLRAMQLSKAALPDALKKAGAAMEKVAERGGGRLRGSSSVA